MEPSANDAAAALPAPTPSTVFVPLLYHELRPEPSAYSYVLPCHRFAEHMRLFARLRQESPGSALPVLTFDDGHMSNYAYAAPMLQEAEANAHFFITAGWTGNRSGYMEPHHLRELHAAGHTVGAHSWSHALLTQCTDAALRRELGDSRAALEDWLSAPVTSMSLPGGRYNARILRGCREAGYTAVWTSLPGEMALPDAPLIGRFNLHGGVSDEFLARLLELQSGVLRRAGRVARLKAAAQRVLGDRTYAQLWAAVNRQETEASEGVVP